MRIEDLLMKPFFKEHDAIGDSACQLNIFSKESQLATEWMRLSMHNLPKIEPIRLGDEKYKPKSHRGAKLLKQINMLQEISVSFSTQHLVNLWTSLQPNSRIFATI